MAEKFFGKPYTILGDSSSNLLLKSNGSVKILWGNKFIDLIKNGKVVSNDSDFITKTISSEDEITKDGIYVLSKDDNYYVYLCIDGNKILISGDGDTKFISFVTEQNLDSSLKDVALTNIGFYYNKLSDLQNLDSGLVFVKETGKLYLIKDKTISEYNTLSYSNKFENIYIGDMYMSNTTLNSIDSFTISINNDNYLVFGYDKIDLSKNLVVLNNSKIMSYGANSTTGFRLYNDVLEGSILEIDTVIIRKDLIIKEYIDITVEELRLLILEKGLKKDKKYRITNFRNFWELLETEILEDYVEDGVVKYKNVRPIIVTAESESTYYEDCYYEDNPEWIIHYDINYLKTYNIDGNQFSALGLITYLKDEYGNSCNFDFKHLRFRYSNDGDITSNWSYIFSNKSGEDCSNLYKNNEVNISNLLVLNLHRKESGTVLYTFEGENYLIFRIECQNNIFKNFECINILEGITFNNNIVHKNIDNSNTFKENAIIENCEFFDNLVDNIFYEESKLTNSIFKNILELNHFKNIIDNTIFNNIIYDNTFNGTISYSQFDKIESNSFEETNIEYCTSAADFNNNILKKSNIINTNFENICVENTFDTNLVLSNNIFKGLVTLNIISNNIENNVFENSFLSNIFNLVIINNNQFKDIVENNTDIEEEVLKSELNSIKIENNIFYKKVSSNLFSILCNLNNNIFNKEVNSNIIKGIINECTIEEFIENTIENGIISNSLFKNSVKKNNVTGYISKCEFVDSFTENTIEGDLEKSVFYKPISIVTFLKSLTSCIVYETIDTTNLFIIDFNNCEFLFSISGDYLIEGSKYNLLKTHLVSNEFKQLEVYSNKELKILSDSYTTPSGSIIMWHGTEIPYGWAICDGNNGTPNLIGRFIKASTVSGEIESQLNDNNELVLTKDNLPKHLHPHLPHSHIINFSNMEGETSYSGDLTSDFKWSDYAWDISTSETSVVNSIDSELKYTTTNVVSSVSSSTLGGSTIGGNHLHSFSISGGNATCDEETSIEDNNNEWLNKPIKIEPRSYALIFIMKL